MVIVFVCMYCRQGGNAGDLLIAYPSLLEGA